MTAIYQRARPLRFEQVVGQEHVKEVLVAALQRGRVGHAYLFSGPRGVGKTTTARLLAMALNCEKGAPEERPCGRCDTCGSIRAAQHPDVIELDAASNNSVEDVRDLREKVRLASVRGGSRVWILDEAHMLSKAAANALLKTLEEPPEGLVFVLATTEPEKLPPTVLSRCQHFRFRRLADDEIRGKLQRLCEEAGVEAEEEALALVSRAADGGMRDAESLLERLLTRGERITRRAAEEALGLPPRNRLEATAEALAREDLGEAWQAAAALYRDGFAPRSLAEQLVLVLRDALFAEVTDGEGFRLTLGRDAQLRVLHALDDELDRFVRRDDLYSLEAALLKAHAAAHGTRPAPPAPAERPEAAPPVPPAAVPAGGLDARATGDRPPPSEKPAAAGEAYPAVAAEADPGAPSDSASASTGRPATGAPPGASAPAPASASSAANASPAVTAPPETAAPWGAEHGAERTAAASSRGPDQATSSDTPAEPPPRSGGGELPWHELRSKASAQLKAFLQPAEHEIQDGRLVLRYTERHRFHYQQLSKRRAELENLVEEVAGEGWALELVGPEGAPPKKA